MGTQRQAVVVGAGIGGLATAIGLRRVGWQVRVLEQASEFAEVGAGITLWPNALRALAALGLDEQARALAEPQRSGGLRGREGRWLTRIDGEQVERRLGLPMVGVHRAALHRMLLEHLPAGTIHGGVTVDDLSELGDADLVVGADGVNSTVRAARWPQHPSPAYCGVTAWRAVVEPSRPPELAVTWTRGGEFGIVPLRDGRVYWYAAMRAPAGSTASDERAAVLRHFGDLHDPVPELIGATDPKAVLHHDLYWLPKPLPSYVDGNVVLVGDAAHAMTPHLGQGGCQALEDAVELAAAVQRQDDIGAAPADYDARRRPRTQSMARASYWAGRLGPSIRNPVLAAIRDGVTQLIPQRLALRQTAHFAGWEPPVLTAAE